MPKLNASVWDPVIKDAKAKKAPDPIQVGEALLSSEQMPATVRHYLGQLFVAGRVTISKGKPKQRSEVEVSEKDELVRGAYEVAYDYLEAQPEPVGAHKGLSERARDLAVKRLKDLGIQISPNSIKASVTRARKRLEQAK